ncbi:MAG: hypothetical protein WCP34_05060 [Pseudomonadota bacterium]
MKFLMKMLALLAVLSSMPVLAETSLTSMIPVADLPGTPRGILDMPLGQVVGIVGGGAVGGALADTFLGGGIMSLAGVVAGMLAGNTWYEKRYWPY